MKILKRYQKRLREDGNHVKIIILRGIKKRIVARLGEIQMVVM